MTSRLSTFFLLFLLSTSLTAQVFVKQDAAGNNDGSSWDDAYTSLLTAIENAPDGSEIWVAAGIHKAGDEGAPPDSTFFFIDKPLSLFGGFAGTESAIDERDFEANPTILSGDLSGDDVPGEFIVSRADNGVHVLFVNFGLLGAVTVDGFIIEGGAAKYGDTPPGEDETLWLGGGLLGYSDMSVRNCIFRQNGGSAGSAMLSVTGAEVHVSDCIFHDNDSENGTVFMVAHFQVTMDNCVFENNHALIFGGAITVGNTNATFRGCSFLNNVASNAVGGGLFVFQNSGNQIPTPFIDVSSCFFSENQAPVGAGFAFNNFYDGTLFRMADCGFVDNMANDFGGGALVQNLDGGTGPTELSAFFERNNFVRNEATINGGGGLALACGAYDLFFDIDTCAFTDNFGGQSGGGLFVLNTGTGHTEGNVRGSFFEANHSDGLGGGADFVNEHEFSVLPINVEGCAFEDNTGGITGGGLSSRSVAAGIPGPELRISGSSFEGNSAVGLGGGLLSQNGKLEIEDSFFADNSTEAFSEGGGAIMLIQSTGAKISRSIFTENTSNEDGAAIRHRGDFRGTLHLDNVLFAANQGQSVITSTDTLSMVNVTLSENIGGLALVGDAVGSLQNSIFSGNEGDNLILMDNATAESKGGNLSDDETMTDILTGASGYDDFNSTEPLLDTDLTPTMDSPCVDAGNPEGIEPTATDALGEARFQGTNIDIGAIESPFMLSSVFGKKFGGTVEVFPNPFSHTLNVESSELPTALRLLDAHGRLVRELPPGQSQFSFGENLPDGAYFLEWEFESGTARKRVVKK